MSQITFFGNNFSVDAFNTNFDKWQEEYHLVLKRHELTPISCKQESLNAMLRWYSNWISSMFAYKGKHFVTKDILKCKGKFVAPKHYNLSDAMSRGLMGYKSPNWKQMIVVTRTKSFNGKSFEDLSDLVYMQMCWYLRSVVLNHQDELDTLEPEELDARSNNSYFDVGNLFSFIRRSKYYKIVGFFADKKKELELETSYDVMLGDDESTSILDLIADESTRKIESEPSVILNFYKRVFNILWKEKVYSKKDKSVLKWAEHPMSKFAWQSYFVRYALEFGEETPVAFNKDFWENKIIKTHKDYWDTMIPEVAAKRLRLILDMIRSLSKDGLLGIYRGAESISKPSKAQGKGSSQNHADRAKGKGKASSNLTPEQEVQVVEACKKQIPLSENFGKIQILHRTVIKTVQVEGKLYKEILLDKDGKAIPKEDKKSKVVSSKFELNLDLEGLSFLGFNATEIGYTVLLGTIEQEYVNTSRYNSIINMLKRGENPFPDAIDLSVVNSIYRHSTVLVCYSDLPEVKNLFKMDLSKYEQKEKEPTTKTKTKSEPYYPRCELPVVYSQVLECKPYLNPTCIGGDQLNLYSGEEQNVTYLVNEYLPNSKGELVKTPVGYETKSFIRNTPEPIKVKIRKDDIVVKESICKKDADTGLTNYLYKGDWLDDLEPEDIEAWYGFVPYWYEYDKDYTLNIPNVVGVVLEDTVGYALVAPLTSILHSYKYEFQNRMNDEGTAMFFQPLEKVSHNSDEKHNIYNGNWKDNPEGKFVKVMESVETPRIYDDIEWGLLSVLNKLESDYAKKYSKKSKKRK